MKQIYKENFFLNYKYNIMAMLVYISLVLVFSPLLGADWVHPGDFNIQTAGLYHAVMIPALLLAVIIASELFYLPKWEKIFANALTYPTIILTFIGNGIIGGLNLPWGLANDVIQGIRDVLLWILAILFIIGLIVSAVKNKEFFKKSYGAFILLIVASVSVAIAPIYAVVSLMPSFWSFPLFSSTISAVGNQTFVGNLITSHSHQILPAAMCATAAIAAVAFSYYDSSKRIRNLVNIGAIISIGAIIAFTIIYWISGIGTYSIPTIFPFGPSGVNGLALDDTLTGLSGWGAVIMAVGVYLSLSKNDKNTKIFRTATIVIGFTIMAILIFIGYSIEFNEAFYGFGSPGTPPTGGPGYMYDLAFMNAHLLTAFFLLPLLFLIFVAFDFMYKKDSNIKRYLSYLSFALMAISFYAVLYATMTVIEAMVAIDVGLLMSTVFIIMVITLIKRKEILLTK